MIRWGATKGKSILSRVHSTYLIDEEKERGKPQKHVLHPYFPDGICADTHVKLVSWHASSTSLIPNVEAERDRD